MIVVTIREPSVPAARRRMAALGKGAGAVELRLDDLAGGDWPSLVEESTLPVIATCRPVHERGGFAGSEEERVAVLRQALAAGAARIDVELGSAAQALCSEVAGNRLVVSYHDHDPGSGRLDPIWERLAQAAPAGGVAKLAFTPERATQCLQGRRLLAAARGDGIPLVMIPMGEIGLPGRLMATAWGSEWAFAAPDDAPPAAPGQPPLFEAADLYAIDDIRPATRLTGLLGWPIAASLSPWMHNRAARDAGLDARYLPFPESDAADLVLNAREWGLAGLSVTHPHKRTVLPWMDEITAAARGCGAVNTILFEKERTRGDNTDAPAARDAVLEGWPGGRRDLSGTRVAVIGAGGAARAMAWAAVADGASVTLYNRDAHRGEASARAVGAQRAPLGKLGETPFDVLVNATPVGTWPDTEAVPVDPAVIGGQVLLDMVSNPDPTRLMQLAVERGLVARSGVRMLVLQGERQFAAWHGQPPPPGSFQAAALEGLRRTQKAPPDGGAYNEKE